MVEAISLFQNCDMKCEGGRVWANLDLPHGARTARRFLLDVKRLLVEWRVNKKAIRIDDVTSTMYIEEKSVLQVEINDGALKLNWLDKSWEDWEALTNSPELLELLRVGKESLLRARDLRAKGQGKGKPAQ